MAEQIIEKQQHAESSGISWVREQDVLTSCLGPEQPGRVHGVSSYKGWKHAWPQFSSMYRKRKRIASVDVEKIKAELRAEVTEDIMTMLAAQGLQIQPISRNPSPAPGRRSSCASASEPTNVDGNNKEDHHEDMDLMRVDVENREDQHDDMDLLMRGRDLDLDSIDFLTDPTPCALLIYPGGYQIEVARGLVYPKQIELHTILILDEHVVVKVEYVHMNFDYHVLKPPPNDETLTLGQALLQKI